MAPWSSKNTPNLLIQVALLLSTLPTSFALFSQTTRWNSVSIQRNSHGTWCYLPVANAVRTVACNGAANSGAASDFASVLNVHLNQGLSIAYYNGIDNALLGGADYSLPAPANMPIIRLCVSGQAGDGYYYETICVNAVADNVLANTPYCEVALGQKQVTDGCYVPNVTWTAPSSTGAATYTAGAYGGSGSGGSNYINSAAGIEVKFALSSIFVAIIVVSMLF